MKIKTGKIAIKATGLMMNDMVDLVEDVSLLFIYAVFF